MRRRGRDKVGTDVGDLATLTAAHQSGKVPATVPGLDGHRPKANGSPDPRGREHRSDPPLVCVSPAEPELTACQRYYRRHRAARLAARRQYVKKNHAKVLLGQRRCYRKYRARYRQRARENHYVKLYGITLRQRDVLIVAQGGRCACCRELLHHPKVDHSHATGQVRGILCNWCNSMLGHAQDSPDRLRAGIAYLRRRPPRLPPVTR